MRALGDRIGGYPQLADMQARARVELEVLGRFEALELRQHARDRVAEREDIELGWLDLGESGA